MIIYLLLLGRARCVRAPQDDRSSSLVMDDITLIWPIRADFSSNYSIFSTHSHGPELVAAVVFVFENAEARRAGREEDDIAGAAAAIRGERNASSILGRDFAGNSSGRSARNFSVALPLKRMSFFTTFSISWANASKGISLSLPPAMRTIGRPSGASARSAAIVRLRRR